MADVLAYAHENNVEPFLEPALELCSALVAADARERLAPGGGSGGRRRSDDDDAGAQLSAAFVAQLPLLLDLSMHSEATVAAAAAQCLSQLVGPALGGAGAGGLLVLGHKPARTSTLPQA